MKSLNKQFYAQIQAIQTQMRYSCDQKQIKNKKNSYQFNLDKDRRIEINSDFDSGNISLIKQVTQLQYRLQCVPDTNTGTNKKCWFYFKVSAPRNIKLRLFIEGVYIYQSMYQEYNWGKPVYKIGEDGKWMTIKDSFLILRDQVNLMIDFTFQSQQPVYIAMSIPFAYWEMQNYLNNLKYIVPESVCYTDEVIKQTKTGKNLHLLTIEDKQLKNYKQVSNTGRSIILITSRIHPGEVSGSFCLMGMLDFILRPYCLQSQILRKMFTFVIVPIVNPEGVYEGNYRMDLNGQNLNRVYLDPNQNKHQTVFAIKQKISEYVKKGDKIMFHFDLHSHSTLRRAFIYGNAFDDIIRQAETQIFCRLLDKNCLFFQESLSQFGEKHMKFKDKGQAISKEGCARVVVSKLASVTYSYTIQSSIFPVEPKSFSQQKGQKKFQPINKDFEIQDQKNLYCRFSFDNFQDKFKEYSQQANIIDQNKNLGIKIMASILDLFLKNPYSSLQQKDIDDIRKQIAWKVLQNQQRFKMLDTKAYHKSKFVTQFAKNQFYTKFKDQWSWLVANKLFKNVRWPQNFTWFKVKNLKDFRKTNKVKTQGRQIKIYPRSQNDVSKITMFPSAISNRLQMSEQIDQLKSQFERLPMIRKSLESKRISNQKEFDMEKKLQQTQNLKKAIKNVLVTNRSNILLTFLDDQEEKRQQKKLSKRRIVSLKMASLNRYSAQKPLNQQKRSDNNIESIQNEIPCLKPSHSQGQLPINPFRDQQKINDQEGYQFEDRFLLKNIQVKKSRKQLMNRKISMLKKINQTRKAASRKSMMKFPQIGKAFLITNAKKKFQKLKTTMEEIENQERSTIQSNQHFQATKSIRVRTQACQIE